jgi:hypothetical protein
MPFEVFKPYMINKIKTAIIKIMNHHRLPADTASELNQNRPLKMIPLENSVNGQKTKIYNLLANIYWDNEMLNNSTINGNTLRDEHEPSMNKLTIESGWVKKFEDTVIAEFPKKIEFYKDERTSGSDGEFKWFTYSFVWNS